MNVGEICNREVVLTERRTPITDAARLMREHHVGSLVVADRKGAAWVPAGILTDRDIVVAVVAGGVDPAKLMVTDVMSNDLVTVREGDSVFDALGLMRRRGIRRVPVLAADGTLVGIVTIDDLLEIVAEELNDLVRAITSEQSREAKTRKGVAL
jgi:CBS domain-containing protein